MTDLATELAARDIAVGIACAPESSTDRGRLERLRAICRLGFLELEIPRLPGLGDATALKTFFDFARRADPDIIHGHGAKGGIYARIAARRLRRRSVYTPHGGSLHYRWQTPQGMLFLGAERMMNSLGSAMIFESEFARTEYRRKVGKPRSPTRVIHNGLSTDEFSAIDARPAYDFVFVGELRRLKGIAVLIEAARLLAERGSRFSIAVFGAGAEEQTFRDAAARAGLNGIIFWMGPSRSGREAFAAARAVVIPSLRESLPYVVLEAAACGRPIIATRVGGIPEILGSDYPLVPAGSPEALAESMAAWLADKVPISALAASARERVASGFTVAKMAEDTLSFYQELAMSGAPPDIGVT